MTTLQELEANISKLADEVAALETAHSTAGIMVPKADTPSAMEAARKTVKDVKAGKFTTLDDLFAAESALEAYAAKLRLSVRTTKPTPASTTTPPKVNQNGRASQLRAEIKQLEAVVPVSKGNTLKCIQANLATKRTELAREEGK